MLLLPSMFVITLSITLPPMGGGTSTKRHSSFILFTGEVQRVSIIQNVHAFEAGKIWDQDMGLM